MKKLLLPAVLLLVVFVGPAQAVSFYFSPDAPADLGAATRLPWNIVRKDNPGIYAPALSLPFGTAGRLLRDLL